MTQSDAKSGGQLARLWPVATFTATYLALALGLGLLRGNLEFLFYIAVMLLLIACVYAVHRHVNLTVGVLWGLSVWGLVHMAGGLLLVPEGLPTSSASRVLYTLWVIPDRLKYDHIVHAYGFGMTTWVCWQGLHSVIRRRGGSAVPTFGLMVLSASAAMGFGALNELVEFVATLLVPETNVGGYLNTGWDLVANLFGASLAATLIWSARRERRESRL